MTIRKRILPVLLLAVLLPLVITLFFVSSLINSQILQREDLTLNTLASVLSDSIEKKLQERQMIFNSELTHLDSQHSNQYEVFLKAGIFPYGSLGLGIYDKDGKLAQSYGELAFPYSLSESRNFLGFQRPNQIIGTKARLGGKEILAESFEMDTKTVIRIANVLEASDILENVRIGSSGYSYLVDSNFTILAHPDISRLGTVSENSALTDVLLARNQGFVADFRIREYLYRGEKKLFVYRPIDRAPWILALVRTSNEVFEPQRQLVYFILIVIGVSAFIVVILSVMFLQFFFLPLKKISNYALDISQQKRVATDKTQLLVEDIIDTDITELGKIIVTIGEQSNRLTDTKNKSSFDDISGRELWFRRALGSVKDAVWEWDSKNNSFIFSEQIRNFFDIEAEVPIAASKFFELCVSDNDRDKAENRFNAFINSKDENWVLEFRSGILGNKDIYCIFRGTAERTELGILKTLYGSLVDITQLRLQDDKIRKLAYFDTLTGLPNKESYLQTCLDLIRQARQNNTKLAVGLVSISRLAKLNISFGHIFGDTVVHRFSERLDSMVRLDGGSAFRANEASFIFTMPGFETREEITKRVAYYSEQLDRNFDIDGRKTEILFELAFSVFPDDASLPLELLRNADTALNTPYLTARRYQAFTPSMLDSLQRASVIEEQIRRALANSSLEIHFQPLVSLKDTKLLGFEVLLRLPGSNDTLVPPALFIPIAEQSGLIIELGAWVLRKTMDYYSEWRNAGFDNFYLAVNIAPQQLYQKDFYSWYEGELQNRNIPIKAIELEITELALVDKVSLVLHQLSQFQSSGVKIALDDFGTGASSITSMSNLPCSKIKIDKGLIQNIGAEPRHLAIIKGIIAMADAMGLEVVAEGLETMKQREILLELGCEIGQGYLFSKPKPASEIPALFNLGRLLSEP